MQGSVIYYVYQCYRPHRPPYGLGGGFGLSFMYCSLEYIIFTSSLVPRQRGRRETAWYRLLVHWLTTPQSLNNNIAMSPYDMARA